MVATLACAWQLWAFHSVRQDDPFITYRYAQNLAQGNGLVFNPGVRFLGATSPAHMLLSAGVYGLFGKALTPTIMAVLGCLAWSAQAVAVFALLMPALGPLGASIVALLIDLGGAESYHWVPFETNVAMACALFGLVAHARGRARLAAALLALGVLFRPELALLSALVFGDLLLSRSHLRFTQALAVFATMVGAWIVFAVAYYGSALPQSARQKFQRAALDAYLQHVWRHLGDVVAPLGVGATGSVLAWVLVLFGALVLARRDRTLLLLALFALLHAATFTFVLRPFVEHTWHLYPCVLPAVVFSAAGLVWLCARARQRVVQVGAAALVVTLIAGNVLRSYEATYEVDSGYWTGQRDAAYQQVAQLLQENLRPDEEFASVEVGTLAYYSERIAYDLGGLISDFATDPMSAHPVRLLVLDKRYLYSAPRRPPITVVSQGEFSAHIFELPVATQP